MSKSSYTRQVTLIPKSVRNQIRPSCCHTSVGEVNMSATTTYWRGVYQAKPKLEPSCPLATIVNCRTASRVRRVDREPLAKERIKSFGQTIWLMAQKLHAYPNTAFTNASLASGPARDWAKSLCFTESTYKINTCQERDGPRAGYQESILCSPAVLLRRGPRITRRGSGRPTLARHQQSRRAKSA